MTEEPPTIAATSSPYTREYYMDGKRLGLSNYERYEWKPDLTLPFARHLQWYLHLTVGDIVMEIGAARGFLVKALRMHGLNARGMDISDWAVENCDPAVRDYMSTQFVSGEKMYDWIIGKDLAEHLALEELKALVPLWGFSARKGIFLVVPLTDYYGGRYIREEDEADPTHKIRFTLPDWLLLLQELLPEFNVNGSFHIHGIKPASSQMPQSCGFLTCTRR